MDLSEFHSNEKHPAFTVLQFLLFVLIFALVTIIFAVMFQRFSESDRGAVGYVGTAEDAETSTLIVVLDAGHGGEDGGTSSESGVLEKDLNLSVTLLLADLLRASGVEVVLTRDSDRLLYDPNSDYHGRKKILDLKTRLDITKGIAHEASGAEVLFVSVHMNSYPSESVKGLQVWYSPNAADDSLRLAESIQSAAQSLLQPENSRKVKKAGSNIYLLDRLQMPAVLVECGFLSNRDEAALLSDESYRKELAFVLFHAIERYASSEDSVSDGSAITESIDPLMP